MMCFVGGFGCFDIGNWIKICVVYEGDGFSFYLCFKVLYEGFCCMSGFNWVKKFYYSQIWFVIDFMMWLEYVYIGGYGYNGLVGFLIEYVDFDFIGQIFVLSDVCVLWIDD